MLQNTTTIYVLLYNIINYFFSSFQYYYDSVIVMIYVLVYNQPLRKNVIDVMF